MVPEIIFGTLLQNKNYEIACSVLALAVLFAFGSFAAVLLLLSVVWGIIHISRKTIECERRVDRAFLTKLHGSMQQLAGSIAKPRQRMIDPEVSGLVLEMNRDLANHLNKDQS